MGMPIGSKIAVNPKNKTIAGRVDNETYRKCIEIMERDNISKSEVIRRGIDLQYKNEQSGK